MFLCHDRVWPNGQVLCCDREILCCDIIDRLREFSIATEYFWVMTELTRQGVFCRDRMFLCHERVGHDREEAMHVRQNRPGAHDRPWACTTELCMRHGNYVVIDLDRAGHDRKLCCPQQS